MTVAEPDAAAERDGGRRSGGAGSWWIRVLVAVPVLVSVVVLWARWPDPPPAPVDVTSSAPVFTDLADLLDAADVVVVATVESVANGRVVTDAADTRSGIRTAVHDVVVERVVAGSGARTGSVGVRIRVEHEVALLDGTPITVDGVPAPVVGERSLYLLVAGTSPDFPHHVVVGPQGRFPINGAVVHGFGSDAISRRLHGTDIDAVVDLFDTATG